VEEILDRGMAEAPVGTGSAEKLEREWIDASRHGDTAAFNRLVLAWESTVYNLALRMLHDPEEAAETTQDVFLRAYRSIHRFRGRARFSTWLYRITANRCLSRLRRRPPGALSLPDSGLDPSSVPREPAGPESQEAALLRAERARCVTRALGELGPDQRAVVELKIFQDRSFEEVATILEAPVSTIKSRFYTSLEILKRRLGGSPP
jgi:RNA polymerase sigma-70 factor (ECF subfamily)